MESSGQTNRSRPRSIELDNDDTHDSTVDTDGKNREAARLAGGGPISPDEITRSNASLVNAMPEAGDGFAEFRQPPRRQSSGVRAACRLHGDREGLRRAAAPERRAVRPRPPDVRQHVLARPPASARARLRADARAEIAGAAFESIVRLRTGIGKQPMAGDRRTRPCADRAPDIARCTMHERMIPRSSAGGVMHTVNCTDAHALIEVMSKRRGCD